MLYSPHMDQADTLGLGDFARGIGKMRLVVLLFGERNVEVLLLSQTSSCASFSADPDSRRLRASYRRCIILASCSLSGIDSYALSSYLEKGLKHADSSGV